MNIKEKSIDSVLLTSIPKNLGSIVESMKPGSHLLSLNRVKEHHYNTISIENAGMEIRDTLAWVFSGGEKDVEVMLVTLARKTLDGNVAENVLRYGAGGLNIDNCRIGVGESDPNHRSPSLGNEGANSMFGVGGHNGNLQPSGRWPANLTHDNSPSVVALFPSPHGAGHSRGGGLSKDGGSMFCGNHAGNGMRFGDSGSASRFFYSAPTLNTIVTYLLKLVTPPNGNVLTNYNMDNLPEEYSYVTD